MEPSGYEETHRTWNVIAGLYEQAFMDLTLYNHTYDAFCAALPSKATLLEIGCGPGNITRYLKRQRPDLQIMAFDVAESMVEVARKHNPEVAFRVLDARDMGLLSGTFQGIVCGFTIPYLSAEDTAKLMVDCARALEPNGLLYLSFVAGDYANSGYISGSTGDRSYFYYHPLTWVQEALTKAGFQMQDPLEVAYPKSDETEETHTILLATKVS